MSLFPLLTPYLQISGPVAGVTVENPSVTVTVAIANGRAFDYYSFDLDTRPTGVTSETINAIVPERVREVLEEGMYTFTLDSNGRTTVQFQSPSSNSVELDTHNGWLFAGAMGTILESLLRGLHEALARVTPWPALRAQITALVWEQVSRYLAAGLPLPSPSDYLFEVLEPIAVVRNTIANGSAPRTSIYVAMSEPCHTTFSDPIHRLYRDAVERLGLQVARRVTKAANSGKHGVAHVIRDGIHRRESKRSNARSHAELGGDLMDRIDTLYAEFGPFPGDFDLPNLGGIRRHGNDDALRAAFGRIR